MSLESGASHVVSLNEVTVSPLRKYSFLEVIAKENFVVLTGSILK